MTADRATARPVIGAYWGRRAESARACAERLSRCVDLLRAADPLLGSWFRGGSTRASAREGPLASGDLGSLTQLFCDGALRRDDNGQAMDSGGYVLTCWNGEDAAPARLSADVGIASDHQVNAVVLELPTVTEAPRLYRPEVSMHVFAAIQCAWEPQWATWTIDLWREAQPLVRSWPPSVGWLTYLSGVEPHPLEVGTMEALSSGAVVRVADTFVGVRLDSVLTVRAELDRAGELRPVRGGGHDA